MDLNPYQFKAPFDAYEFANFHLQQRTKILLCSMAWLSSDVEDEEDYDDREDSVIRYWCNRLLPLIINDNLNDNNGRNNGNNILVVMCNRTGTEDGKLTYLRLK